MVVKAKSLVRGLFRWDRLAYLGYALLLMSLQTERVFAEGSISIDNFVGRLKETFTLVQQLMVVVAFVCGMVFMIIGLLKFKAHKDNPAQIPLSTPIALIAVAAGLLFLPTVFDLAGSALFGDAAKSGLPMVF